MDASDGRDGADDRRLGPLEWRVLEALWAGQAGAAVRDLQPRFPDIAYTTLLTTLERLHRKQLLNRTKVGRAYRYAPRLNRREFESDRATTAVRAALARDRGALEPILSCLVEAVGDRDRELLDELETLVKARRAELEERDA